MKPALTVGAALLCGLLGCKYDLGQLSGATPPDAEAPDSDAQSPPGDAPAEMERPPLPVLPKETVARSSLAAYWPLDEGQGIYAWDVTGNGNDGMFMPAEDATLMIAGPHWREPGYTGSLFHNKGDVFFDGVDDYIEFKQTTLPEIGLSLSFTLWARYDYDVQPTDISSLFILLNRDSSAGLRLELRGQRLRMATYFSTDVSPEIVGVPAPRQGWHFVAYTFDGTTHTLYVDDLPPVTSSFATNERGKPNRCRIGKSSSNVPDAFKGFLDDVRLYDRALTPTEVASLHAGAP